MGKAPVAFQTAVDYGPMQPVTHCVLVGPPDVLFEGQMDMVPWPCGAVPGAASRETTTCDLQQDTVSRAGAIRWQRLELQLYAKLLC